MTLEQVMALDGRELDRLVAERLGWLDVRPIGSEWEGRNPGFVLPGVYRYLPHFSRDWSAAMQIRDWARGLDAYQQAQFVNELSHVVYERLKREQKHASNYLFLDAECPDYCRAALLVSP